MAGLVIKPRARILHGHDWVYASDVLKAFGGPADGEIVSLKDGRDHLLGSAIYNSQSQIVARRFSRQRQDLDLDFFTRRLSQALDYRRRRGVNLNACRLVWSESDGLPGVIVDRYGSTLVLQTLTLAMDRRLPLIVEALVKTFAPAAIVERNDAPIRRAEGMELRTGVLLGEPAQIEMELLGLRFQIDSLHGQKTGFYLDQIENYREVAAWAKGRRVLDAFSNQGAFALACARASAAETTAVEISAEAVEQIRANATRNGLAVNAIAENVFDFLKREEAAGAQYDLIILDPPSFTKSKGKLHDAMRGYKEIHLRALKLLAPDGLLATFSCSHHVSAELFKEMIVDALVDAKRSARQLRTLQQAPDHPILATLPETEYLKGFLLELAPGR
ncbi:MAG: rRNA (cytosine1962-C5)-methyltransferase [Chthoniobacter sp.]|jgi:23S rRNA (cytosine1962-C5)-methyltransferase|nr:rRNA (cytosine1962-C5)-methyltransferase [Chthoniobacter sp.]